jgi:glutathione S-transferase
VVELRRFLPARHRGLKDRLERQPYQAGRRIQAADRAIAPTLQRLSRLEPEDELTLPIAFSG